MLPYFSTALTFNYYSFMHTCMLDHMQCPPCSLHVRQIGQWHHFVTSETSHNSAWSDNNVLSRITSVHPKSSSKSSFKLGSWPSKSNLNEISIVTSSTTSVTYAWNSGPIIPLRKERIIICMKCRAASHGIGTPVVVRKLMLSQFMWKPKLDCWEFWFVCCCKRAAAWLYMAAMP